MRKSNYAASALMLFVGVAITVVCSHALAATPEQVRTLIKGKTLVRAGSPPQQGPGGAAKPFRRINAGVRYKPIPPLPSPESAAYLHGAIDNAGRVRQAREAEERRQAALNAGLEKGRRQTEQMSREWEAMRRAEEDRRRADEFETLTNRRRDLISRDQCRRSTGGSSECY